MRYWPQLPSLHGRRRASTVERSAMNPPVKPGDVLRIPEADYLYGVGVLVLRVSGVGAVERLPDGEWLAVKGMEVAWNGADLKEREVLVRMSALSKRRPAT